MAKTFVVLTVPDLSSFTRALGRALREALAASGDLPGHQALMNLVAQAAGYRNVQALRASARPPRLARDRPPAPPLTANGRKALLQFDTRGRLVRWPNKLAVQRLAMWVLWMRFEPRRRYSEREVNAILANAHTYGDHVTLRRELVNHGLLARELDCSVYWKLPARPTEEERAVLRAWRDALSA